MGGVHRGSVAVVAACLWMVLSGAAAAQPSREAAEQQLSGSQQRLVTALFRDPASLESLRAEVPKLPAGKAKRLVALHTRAEDTKLRAHALTVVASQASLMWTGRARKQIVAALAELDRTAEWRDQTAEQCHEVLFDHVFDPKVSLDPCGSESAWKRVSAASDSVSAILERQGALTQSGREKLETYVRDLPLDQGVTAYLDMLNGKSGKALWESSTLLRKQLAQLVATSSMIAGTGVSVMRTIVPGYPAGLRLTSGRAAETATAKCRIALRQGQRWRSKCEEAVAAVSDYVVDASKFFHEALELQAGKKTKGATWSMEVWPDVSEQSES